MTGSNGNSQRVYACTAYKFFNLVWLGIFGIFGTDIDIIFNAGQLTQFPFYHSTMSMGIFYYFFGNGNIFLKRMMGTVDHYRSETTINTSFTNFKISAMIQMQRNWNMALLLQRSLYQFYQIGMVGIFSCSGRYLQN